jgi:hypothetical protein
MGKVFPQCTTLLLRNVALGERFPPPVQGQRIMPNKAEFVICDHTIEEMFADFKRHGFDLQSTHLRHFLRLSRLTLLVALLYLWCVAFGVSIIKRGLRCLVDRSDRRDLSIFRIGYDMIGRCLTNGKPFSIRLLPYFQKVYGR